MRSHAGWFLGFVFALSCAWSLHGGESSPAAPGEGRTELEAELTAWIDRQLEAAWDSAGVKPAGPAEEEQFLRRAHLDLLGRIPRVSEVHAYLADTEPNRRERLIESLLERPDFAGRLAILLTEELLPAGADARRFGGAVALESWLQGRLAERNGWDRIVRELLEGGMRTGQGPQYFYAAHQGKPEELAATVARVFLGRQIGCAQCHGHPFAAWSQREFWGFAAFFAESQPRIVARGGGAAAAAPVVQELKIPGTEEVVPPRFLDGAPYDPETAGSRREQLAAWLTAAENPYFAEAVVNRVWGNLFGRGLVEPVDDFDTSSVSHPEILQRLAAHFVHSGFELRSVYRVLAATRAYQADSARAGHDDPHAAALHFAHMPLRPLDGEQLHASLALLAPTFTAATGPFGPVVGAARQRQMFVERFQSVGGSKTEYEAGIPQALLMMHGERLRGMTSPETSEFLLALEAPWFTEAERVETLFLAVLGRRPTAAERARFEAHLEGAGGDRRQARGDLLWALLNSAEFATNH